MNLTSYRTLGRSGLVVSPLALGTMTFGTARWGSDQAGSAAVFHAYVEAGGNFVDTADVYAGGRSEEMLGTFLAEQKLRDKIVVATKAKAEQIENDLRQGKSFAQLAKAYSTDSSTKAKGGAMGTFSEAELSASEPAIATAAFKLAKGQVSQPIAVSGSYEIVQCTAVNPAHTPSLAEERSAIIQAIKQQNAESEPQLVAQLIKSDKVNILDPTYSSVLTQLENPTTTSTSSSGY